MGSSKLVARCWVLAPWLILKGLLDGRLSLLADVQFLPDALNGHDG
jgi:hypothetical protein